MTTAVAVIKPIRESRADRKYRQMTEFCQAFLSYPNTPAAARVVGISVRTANNWLRSDLWKKVYGQSRRPSLETQNAMATAAAPGALETLVEVAQDKTSPKTARVAAAAAILQESRNTAALLHERRLSEIEAALVKLYKDSHK